MKGGGLGRSQSKFGLAAVFATLGSFLRMGARSAQVEARKGTGSGHPLHRKYLRSLYNKFPAMPYPGYCAGVKETDRRHRQANPWLYVGGRYRGVN